MRSIGAYEAKTHLPRLLEDVRNGQGYLITKHGQPVARLLPVNDEAPSLRRKAISKLIEARSRHRLDGLKLRDLIDEGRR